MGRLAGAVAGSTATGKLRLPCLLSLTRAMAGYGSEVEEARIVGVGAMRSCMWCLVSSCRSRPIRAA
jgi:hypothetical protein